MSLDTLEVREDPDEGKAQVGSFGERLRREREMRGVTLDDIADGTKIGTRLLRALEEEHFELLPGGIFNKGFVRAYAKYLGLNEEEAVADYLEAAGEITPDPRIIAEQNSSRIDRSGGHTSDSRNSGFPVIPVLILLLVIAAGAGGWQIYQERVRDRQAKLQAGSSSVVTAPTVAAPVATNSATPAAPSVPTLAGATKSVTAGNGAATTPNTGVQAGTATTTRGDLNAPPPKTNELAANKRAIPSPNATVPGATGVAGPNSAEASTTAVGTQTFEVKVRAKDNAWVSIKSDGKYLVRGIIGPPDVRTVHASDQVVFYTGNAGAVEVSFNGQPIPLPGGPNTEGVLVFNSHGVVPPKPGQ